MLSGVLSSIGRAAVFLASPDADYITGIELVVDGGLRGAGGASATENSR